MEPTISMHNIASIRLSESRHFLPNKQNEHEFWCRDITFVGNATEPGEYRITIFGDTAESIRLPGGRP